MTQSAMPHPSAARPSVRRGPQRYPAHDFEVGTEGNIWRTSILRSVGRPAGLAHGEGLLVAQGRGLVRIILRALAYLPVAQAGVEPDGAGIVGADLQAERPGTAVGRQRFGVGHQGLRDALAAV